ncbi:MAG: hypothetical protein A3F12_05795 [Gammaproteobacteria bacterium RIFCSPHIGHO2_12_FULL_38_14]|nr:MAG: hypothetical protein A3F12_05795 [Gammaproteobacteria bacterium RIFCSPHIGHO2_12_FULL_38_14]
MTVSINRSFQSIKINDIDALENVLQDVFKKHVHATYQSYYFSYQDQALIKMHINADQKVPKVRFQYCSIDGRLVSANMQLKKALARFLWVHGDYATSAEEPDAFNKFLFSQQLNEELLLDFHRKHLLSATEKGGGYHAGEQTLDQAYRNIELPPLVEKPTFVQKDKQKGSWIAGLFGRRPADPAIKIGTHHVSSQQDVVNSPSNKRK